MADRKQESIQRIREGKFRIGPPPFGYRFSDGRLVVVGNEADVVRLIFDMHDAGVSSRGIAGVLTESGYETPSGNMKPWGYKMVSIIINRRSFYLGETSMLNGIMFCPTGDVCHPRIIDPVESA